MLPHVPVHDDGEAPPPPPPRATAPAPVQAPQQALFSQCGVAPPPTPPQTGGSNTITSLATTGEFFAMFNQSSAPPPPIDIEDDAEVPPDMETPVLAGALSAMLQGLTSSSDSLVQSVVSRQSSRGAMIRGLSASSRLPGGRSSEALYDLEEETQEDMGDSAVASASVDAFPRPASGDAVEGLESSDEEQQEDAPGAEDGEEEEKGGEEEDPLEPTPQRGAEAEPSSSSLPSPGAEVASQADSPILQAAAISALSDAGPAPEEVTGLDTDVGAQAHLEDLFDEEVSSRADSPNQEAEGILAFLDTGPASEEDKGLDMDDGVEEQGVGSAWDEDPVAQTPQTGAEAEPSSSSRLFPGAEAHSDLFDEEVSSQADSPNQEAAGISAFLDTGPASEEAAATSAFSDAGPASAEDKDTDGGAQEASSASSSVAADVLEEAEAALREGLAEAEGVDKDRYPGPPPSTPFLKASYKDVEDAYREAEERAKTQFQRDAVRHLRFRDTKGEGRYQAEDILELVRELAGAAGREEQQRASPYGLKELFRPTGPVALLFLLLLALLVIWITTLIAAAAARELLAQDSGVMMMAKGRVIAGAATSKSFANLAALQTMPEETLGNIRDCTFVHNGAFHRVSVASLTRTADGNVSIAAADSSTVLLKGSLSTGTGRMTFRRTFFDDEEVNVSKLSGSSGCSFVSMLQAPAR